MTDTLPPGWEWACLGDLCTPRAGKVIPVEDDPRPYLSLDNIASEVGRIDGWECAGDYRSQSVELSPGDVAYARLRPYLNKVAVTDRAALGSAELIVLPPSDGLVPQFLKYHLLSSRFVRFAQEASTGDRPRLKWRQMRHYTLAVPPLAEQQRIVAAIKEHFSRLDAVESGLASAVRQATQLRQRIVDDRLGVVDARIQPLSEFLTERLVNGRSVPTATSGGVPVLRLTALKDGFIDPAETKQGDFGDTDPRRFAIAPSDFLISRGNGSLQLVGRGGLVSQGAPPVAFPDTLIRARVDESRLSSRYLSLAWHSREVRRQLESQARTTAGIYKVNQSMIGAIEFPVPALDVQHQLVQVVEEARWAAMSTAAALNRCQARSSALRRSILAQAFAGRLVPQGSGGESASVMLEMTGAGA